MSDNH
jgi:hypothetical protein